MICKLWVILFAMRHDTDTIFLRHAFVQDSMNSALNTRSRTYRGAYLALTPQKLKNVDQPSLGGAVHCFMGISQSLSSERDHFISDATGMRQGRSIHAIAADETTVILQDTTSLLLSCTSCMACRDIDNRPCLLPCTPLANQHPRFLTHMTNHPNVATLRRNTVDVFPSRVLVVDARGILSSPAAVDVLSSPSWRSRCLERPKQGKE